MIVDGKQIAVELIAELKQKVSSEKSMSLCFVMFGENKASEQFIGVKSAIATDLDIIATTIVREVTTTDEAVAIVAELSSLYDGIVVQLPLPSSIDAQAILDAVPVEKDIDVLSTAAKDAFIQKKSERIPPVAGAVQTIFTRHDIDLAGKNIVVVGKGKLVGAPVSAWLAREGIVHEVVTINTPEDKKVALLKDADIIISGTGRPASITRDMVKDGVVLIDAGTTEQAGKLVGDIDPKCAEKALLYTPVPGGVGPITVACLFQNLFRNN